MPYKDPERQKIAQKNHYLRNKNKFKDRNTVRRNKLKTKLWKYKLTIQCIRCGQSHPAALDFHHPTPAEKDMSPSKLLNQYMSWDRLKQEIDKCIVLCASCHRIEHFDLKPRQEWEILD